MLLYGGGAVLMFVRGISLVDATVVDRFPDNDRLAKVLGEVNPHLRQIEGTKPSETVADSVFDDNEDERFDEG